MRTGSLSSRSKLVRAVTAAGLFAIPIALAAVPLSTLENAPKVCLLLRFGEMMLQVRIVLVFVNRCDGGAHTFASA